MKRRVILILLAMAASLALTWIVIGQSSSLKKWQRGKGWRFAKTNVVSG